VNPLVSAELQARRRSLAAIGAGCLLAAIAFAGTYSAFGGQEGVTRAFGISGTFAKVIAALSGSPSADIYTAAGFLGYSFSHPIIEVLTISVAVSSGVAAIAADVESGRAEMLYTAPVSRSAILGARLIGWLIAQTAVMACLVVGSIAGSRLSPAMHGVSPLVPLRAALQFGALLFFLGCAAFAASARARTRGAAMAGAVGIAAGSYVVNLVALLWSPLRFLRHLNPFGYYNSSAAAHHINWPDAGLLVSIGTLLLVLSRHWLENRDLT
jgi:ABC-type transport system involved in multi-copper enzyme maturation permease subunit